MSFPQTDPGEQGQCQQEPGHSSVLLPTHTSPVWGSLHNLFREQLVECGSVAPTGFYSADLSSPAAVSMFTSTQVCLCPGTAEELNQQEQNPKGKVKIPPKTLLFSISSCRMQRYIFNSNSRPSAL